MPSAQADYDVAVIGAGPIGSNTAALIARKGWHVALVDKHALGARVSRCGCLVTPRVLDMVDASRAVVSRVHGAVVHSPSGRKITIDGRETKAVVLDRALFDEAILSRAIHDGAECIFDTTAKSARRIGGRVEIDLADSGDRRKISAKILVGADGTMGSVPEWFSTSKPKKMLTGCEQTIAGVAGDDGFVKLFVGRDFSPGFFGWIVPMGDSARVGLCIDHGNVQTSLRLMMSKPFAQEYTAKAEPMAYSAGRIPIGYARKTHAANVMVVGDAACQVKATSGGGMFPGLVCSSICADTAVESLEENDFSAAKMRQYHRAWTRRIGKELRKDLAIHESFARLNDKHFEEIFDMMSNPAIIDLIQNLGDIDFPSKVGWALVLEEPRLVKYAGKALRALLPRPG